MGALGSSRPLDLLDFPPTDRKSIQWCRDSVRCSHRDLYFHERQTASGLLSIHFRKLRYMWSRRNPVHRSVYVNLSNKRSLRRISLFRLDERRCSFTCPCCVIYSFRLHRAAVLLFLRMLACVQRAHAAVGLGSSDQRQPTSLFAGAHVCEPLGGAESAGFWIHPIRRRRPPPRLVYKYCISAPLCVIYCTV